MPYLAVHDDLVVDAELALGHAGQVALHHHLASHVGRQNLTNSYTKLQIFLLHHFRVKLPMWRFRI